MLHADHRLLRSAAGRLLLALASLALLACAAAAAPRPLVLVERDVTIAGAWRATVDASIRLCDVLRVMDGSTFIGDVCVIRCDGQTALVIPAREFEGTLRAGQQLVRLGPDPSRIPHGAPFIGSMHAPAVRYRISLTEPAGATALTYRDDRLEVAFQSPGSAVRFRLREVGELRFIVDWDHVRYCSPGGIWTDLKSPQSMMKYPFDNASDVLDDDDDEIVLFPEGYLSTAGYLCLLPSYAQGAIELKGHTFGVDMPVEFSDGSTRLYHFRFAIDVETVRTFLGVEGIGIHTIDIADGKRVFTRAVRVDRVVPASPAQRAGIRPGDVILSIGGRDVPNADRMLDAISAADPARETEVVVYAFDTGVRHLRIRLTPAAPELPPS